MFKKKITPKEPVRNIQQQAIQDAVKAIEEAPKPPQPNEAVRNINTAIAELQKIKPTVCAHESADKNGVKKSYFSAYANSVYFATSDGYKPKEEYHQCMHCGADIKPTGWELA